MERRPAPKLKQKRTDVSGDYHHDYSQFKEGQNAPDQHLTGQVMKMQKVEKYSPRARKVMLKKDLLKPIKPLPMEVPGHTQIGKLDKKNSKKLVIKVNEKRHEENLDKKPEPEPQPSKTEKLT